MSDGRGTFGTWDQDDPDFGRETEAERWDDHEAPHESEHHDDFYHPDDYDHHGSHYAAPPAGRPRPAGGSHRRPAPRRTGRRRHPILTAIVVIIAVILVLVGVGLIWAHGQIDPGKPGADVSVSIPQGSSTSQIGSDLDKAGIIHNGSLFALYVRLHGDGPLLAGSYSLPKNSSYSAAISALEAGPKILTDTLTIPPGLTLAQVATAVGALPGLGLSAHKFLSDANTGVVRSLFEPAGTNNLEGLLYPDSYDVAKGETEADVLEKLVNRFDAQAESLGLAAAAAKLGYSPYQVVEVASIVEREAKLDANRADVASAIYNRLRIRMKLGADSTQTYYLRLTDPNVQPTVAQLDSPSPYNTRTNTGLPPTAIANVGLPSLRAAANPASTTYLYFVEINPDGELGFASTNSGFEQLQRECRAAKLC